MLRLMRDHATSWFIKVILGAIVIVFVLWGVGGFNTDKPQVATVNGEVITRQAYARAYDNLLKNYRENYQGELDEAMIDRIRSQALDSLIDQVLLDQEAKKMDIRVPDAELAGSIRDFKAFQGPDDRFDQQRYQRILSRMNMTPEDFEEQQRQSLRVQKLRALIVENVQVSEGELRDWYNWQNARTKVNYLAFETGDYPDIAPTEAELEQYYQANQEQYKTQPRVKVQYVAFKTADHADAATVTDAEVEGYYNDHPKEFENPKKVKARHILIKVDQKANDQAVEAAREKAQKVYELATEAGADFAELAREHSEGPSKSKGGDLGEFTKDRMVKPFADKAFSMEPGEISQPVRTRFGWHVIKVEGVTPAGTTSLEEARDAIRKKLKDQKSDKLASQAAETFYDTLFEYETLSQAAEAEKQPLKTTDFFTQQGPKGIQNARKIGQAAFKLDEKGDLSEIVDGGDGYYILEMVADKPAQVDAFENVKERVKRDLIREKQTEKARADAQKALEALKTGEKDLHDLAEKLDKTPKSSGFFERRGSIPEIGWAPEFQKAAFKLSRENPLPEAPVKTRKGYYVLAFEARQLPDDAEFEKEKADIRDRLLRQKQYQAFQTWLSQVREDSEIAVEADILN